MDRQRRRIDQLPSHRSLSTRPLERARDVCAHVADIGIASAIALHVPDDGGRSVPCADAGRVEPVLDVARRLAEQAVRDGRSLQVLDTEPRSSGRSWRHAAIPLGRMSSGTVVLVASDARLARREAQALAAWAAPACVAGAEIEWFGGPATRLAGDVARRFDADVVSFALFAQSGMIVNHYVRSGALLHTMRLPVDTIWGEVARHGAAFTLGDLRTHAGTQQLGSVGMSMAGLVGLENGRGLPVGALGVATADELSLDVAHDLLAVAPSLGPALMQRMSATQVPVADADGAIDLRVLAARVGCERFAMYELQDNSLHFVAAHARDGARTSAPPEERERRLVLHAVQHGVGAFARDAAAVLIGDRTVLYAQDSVKRALDCLRRALEDVRHNPFGHSETVDASSQADADAA